MRNKRSALMRRRRIIPGLAVAAALCACAVGPDFERPAAPELQQYVQDPRHLGGDAGLTYSAARDVAADWWRVFGVHEIDDLVDRAVRDNPSLAAAQDALQRSQDNLRAGYGAFFPQINASLGATHALSAPALQGYAQSGSVYSVVTAGVSVGYTLDLFGLQRRTVEGLEAQMEEQRNLARATYVSLTANVVNTAIACAAYTEQIDAAGRVVALMRRELELTQAQVRSGTAAPSALLLLQSSLQSQEAVVESLRQRRAQSLHLLVSLLGQEPGQVRIPALRIESLAEPVDLPLSMPSVLVQQRPDILVAQAQLHEASASIGIATAAMLPSVTLGASAGVVGSGLGDLSQGSGEPYWSVGPTVNLPIFEGGAQWYARAAAVDAYHQAQAQYRQTVIGALQQVSDTLTALAHDTRSLQDWRGALDAARTYERLLDANVRAGMAAELDLLAAQIQTQQVRSSWAQALAQRQQDTAALYVALGGGWWNQPTATAGDAASIRNEPAATETRP